MSERSKWGLLKGVGIIFLLLGVLYVIGVFTVRELPSSSGRILGSIWLSPPRSTYILLAAAHFLIGWGLLLQKDFYARLLTAFSGGVIINLLSRVFIDPRFESGWIMTDLVPFAFYSFCIFCSSSFWSSKSK